MGLDDLIPTSDKFYDPATGYVKWDELEATAYKRVITSQHDFVRFMQSLFVPDDDILFPPEGGWPQITKESFAAIGKTDKVIEVLRNMAYIKDPLDSSPREILEETALFDWTESYFVEQITAGDGGYTIPMTELPDELAPRDVVGLTTRGRGVSTILLDCRYGIVRWLDCSEGVTLFGGSTKGDPSGRGDQAWGGETAWPVEEFFEYMKAKFVSLEQLTYNQSHVIRKGWVSM